jgi:4-diphosphocytidyl-2-C-methyl-D-erythritol kinase
LTRDTSAITIAAFFETGGHNDCEGIVRQLYSEIDLAFKWLNQFGKARLTGTGACVFLAFENEAEAKHVFQRLPNEFQGFVARGVNISPTHRELNLL